MINSHALYRLSYGGITAKHPIGCLAYVGVFLFFQIVTNQVSSALLSLTSVFGMGTGGPSASSTPTLYGSLSPYILNILFFLVTRAGIEPALPAWEAGVLTAWPTSRFLGDWLGFVTARECAPFRALVHHQGFEPGTPWLRVRWPRFNQYLAKKRLIFISLFFHIQNCNTERKDDYEY